MKMPSLFHRKARAPEEPASEPPTPSKSTSSHGVGDAFGISGVLYEPDRLDDAKYTDRTDGELHWAETNPDDPATMP